MPNWCDNRVKITGHSGVFACLAAIAGETSEDGVHHIDFTKIVPPPEYCTDSWCMEHWGTKWNATDSQVCTDHSDPEHKYLQITDQEAQFWFQTAWSPPVPVIVALGKLFPDLTFELGYGETGLCFPEPIACGVAQSCRMSTRSGSRSRTMIPLLPIPARLSGFATTSHRGAPLVHTGRISN